MKVRKALELARLLLLLFLVLDRGIKTSLAGNSAKRAGLVGTNRIDGSSFNNNQDSSSNKLHPHTSIDNFSNSTSATQRLKSSLFARYDKTVMPVVNHSQNVLIRVGFTYRQVLDLDEKNQILKSLLWYRSSWYDQNLKWEPTDFENISELEVPHSLVWRPDIVMYEEIGDKDYSPRLPYVSITSKGMVEYKEPCAFHTSCAIDTSFFPFDVQVCHMTYVSWTQPVTHIDLITDREPQQLMKDAKQYFINTGEWQFVKLSARKKMKDYGNLITNDSEDVTVNTSKDPELPFGEIWLPSTTPADYTSLGNITASDRMFAEVTFTIVVRRNSSLYMQSMLFPSILLTTVALLGFYLPPDSGERIGLQITILLTFMVFLLAVGEMFPASTGPYLGIYFVICMGLLGINLLMTVIVLHVHFKPVVNVDPKLMKRKPHCIGRCRRFFGCNDSSDDEKTRMQKMRKKELYRTRSAVPRVTRKILQFCDRYWSVGEVGARWMKTISDDELDDVTVDDVMQDTDNSETMTDDDDVTWVDSRDEAMLKTEVVRTSANVSDKSRPSVVVDAVSLPHVVEGISVPSVASKKSEIDGFIMLQQNHQNNEAEISPEKKMETLGLKMPRKSFSNPTTLKRSISDSSKTEEVKMGRPTSSGRPEGSEHESRSGSIVSNIFRHRVLGVVGDVRDYIRKSEMTRVKKRKSRKRRKRERREKRKEEEQERQDLEQEEWKSVARAIDVIFFRFYVFFIVVSHVGLLGKALHSWLVDDRL